MSSGSTLYNHISYICMPISLLGVFEQNTLLVNVAVGLFRVACMVMPHQLTLTLPSPSTGVSGSLTVTVA